LKNEKLLIPHHGESGGPNKHRKPSAGGPSQEDVLRKSRDEVRRTLLKTRTESLISVTTMKANEVQDEEVEEANEEEEIVDEEDLKANEVQKAGGGRRQRVRGFDGFDPCLMTIPRPEFDNLLRVPREQSSI
jgi:hypothetical protein